MKKILLSLSAILTLLFSSSCTEEVSMENGITPGNDEYVTVNIKLGGEILDITQEPMTKGLTSNDLTAIQIKEVVVNDYEEEVPYAWGLFDDVSNISVKLKKGAKYDIEATTIIEGKVILGFSSDGYNNPFNLNDGVTFVTNKFDISSTLCFLNLYSSNIALKGVERSYEFSKADKYYYTNSFVVQENSDISFDMKRVSSGLKITTNNLTTGSLLVESNDFEQIVIKPGEEFDEIYTIPWYFRSQDSNSWDKDDCKVSTMMTFTYQDASGEKTQIASQKIEFTRNKKTVITVNIPADEEIDSQKSAIKVSLDDTPMVDGDKITIG